MRKLTKKMGFFMVFAATLTLVACGEKTTNDRDAKKAASAKQQTQKTLTPEERVKQRVEARWAIRQAGKVEGLYDYLSPAIRQVVDRYSYQGRFGNRISYLSAQVQQVDCNQIDDKPADACQVNVYVSYKNDQVMGGAPLNETWVYENGQWWFADQ